MAADGAAAIMEGARLWSRKYGGGVVRNNHPEAEHRGSIRRQRLSGLAGSLGMHVVVSCDGNNHNSLHVALWVRMILWRSCPLGCWPSISIDLHHWPSLHEYVAFQTYPSHGGQLLGFANQPPGLTSDKFFPQVDGLVAVTHLPVGIKSAHKNDQQKSRDLNTQHFHPVDQVGGAPLQLLWHKPSKSVNKDLFPLATHGICKLI